MLNPTHLPLQTTVAVDCPTLKTGVPFRALMTALSASTVLLFFLSSLSLLILMICKKMSKDLYLGQPSTDYPHLCLDMSS